MKIIAVVIVVLLVADISTRVIETKPLRSVVYPDEVTLNVPAVDNDGNGVITVLKVRAVPGSGRVLADVNQLLFWTDTQYSIQTAKNVAGKISDVDLTHVDLSYSIETQASAIEGPSAGAALTIATIAALENKTLDSSVMITGTINSDGTIGEVGGAAAKATAAKDVGAKLFLVPEGQSTSVEYTPQQNCTQDGAFTVCSTNYVKQTESVANASGIEVKEVSNIRDALKYFGLQS